MKFKAAVSATPLVVIALALALSSSAFAGPINLNFNCGDVPPPVLNGSGCTPPAGGSVFTSWAQQGFTVMNTGGTNNVYNTNWGNKGPGMAPNFGTPGLTFLGSGAITITEGGKLFDFNSVDLLGKLTYTITFFGANGLLIGADTLNGTVSTLLVPNPNALYQTITDDVNGVTKVVITINDPGKYQDRLDDIVVTALNPSTPEPSGLFLLGTGMLALALLVRRKPAA